MYNERYYCQFFFLQIFKILIIQNYFIESEKIANPFLLFKTSRANRQTETSIFSSIELELARFAMYQFSQRYAM